MGEEGGEVKFIESVPLPSLLRRPNNSCRAPKSLARLHPTFPRDHPPNHPRISLDTARLSDCRSYSPFKTRDSVSFHFIFVFVSRRLCIFPAEGKSSWEILARVKCIEVFFFFRRSMYYFRKRGWSRKDV